MSSKLTLKFFTVPEWEKEQDYLRSMHRNGTSGGNTGTPVAVLKELIRKHREPCPAEYKVVFLKGIRT